MGNEAIRLRNSGAVTAIAVDLGASGGRVVRASWNGSHLRQQVVHRFANVPVHSNGRLSWNLDELVTQIGYGIDLANQLGPVESVGVDAWGVDYGLLDEAGALLAAPACYRGDPAADVFASRTADENKRLYQCSGVIPMSINTVFQLTAESLDQHGHLAQAAMLLMTPDLVHHALCGCRVSEQTIASTSGLLNLGSRTWDHRLIADAGLPPGIFPELVAAGQPVGELLRPSDKSSRSIQVVAPACHDTADAVVAAPLQDDTEVFVCTGTWFLVGRETRKPVTSREALDAGLSNECGVGDSILTMANVTGLWILEQCRAHWAEQGIDVSYERLNSLAASEQAGRWLFDPDCPMFDHPYDMPDAIRSYCKRTGQEPPKTVGEIARAIVDSLAARCAQVIKDLDTELGSSTAVVVVGGGTRNELLIQAIASFSALQTRVGPAEATSAGNGAIQLMAAGEFSSIEDIRAAIRTSTGQREYQPQNTDVYREAFARWQSIRARGRSLGLGHEDDEGARDGITRN